MLYRKEEQLMNDMYYPRREDDGVTIDIKSLLNRFLIKRKIILGVVIVCTVIGGIIGFLGSGSNNDAAADLEDKVTVAARELTETQKKEAENYCEQLKAYDMAIGGQKKLNSESYFMNLDPSTAVGSNLWYLIDTELGNATSIYTDIINDEDYRKISEILGTDSNSKYLKDVVTILSDESIDTYGLDITRTDRMSGDIKSGYKLLLKLTVTAPDRDSCEKIVDIADAAVQRETDNLARYGAKIKCILLNNRAFDTDVEERIVTANIQKTNALGTLETNRGNFYNNVVSKVDTGEKAYIDALYSADTEEIQEVAKEDRVSWKQVLKYVIVCAFAGFIAVVCVITAMYVSEGKIHAADDLNGMGIPVLQTLTAEEPVLFSLLMEELKKNTEAQAKKIYIAADKSSAVSMEYANRIYDEAGGTGCYVGCIEPDADNMKQLLESDTVLILPVIECTKRNSIYTFIDICARNNVNIIGSAPII